jgi:hypothetical protein
MKWQGIENDCVYQRTISGERAVKYYYVYEIKRGEWKAGRFAYGREYDYTRKTFTDSRKARAYCQRKDKEAIIIEAVTA